MKSDKWWARQDSNLEPTGYEPDALPLSYGPCVWIVYPAFRPINLGAAERSICNGPGKVTSH